MVSGRRNSGWPDTVGSSLQFASGRYIVICNLETEDEQSAMPFEKSPETLTRLVSAAVGGSQQISEALDEVGYDVTEL